MHATKKMSFEQLYLFVENSLIFIHREFLHRVCTRVRPCMCTIGVYGGVAVRCETLKEILED